MAGFAVIDLETTGFAYNGTDRVCEIAVVLVDPAGRKELEYTTLVNPKRDLGAQHIHHIDATEARIAPTFDQLVGDVTELLTGRVVVAHNSAFDTSFLVAEYARAGWPINLTSDMTLCTMRLAREYGAPPKLGACCESFGILLDNAHAALADAVATASLLDAYMRASQDRRMWDQWLEFGESVQWPHPPVLNTPPVLRGITSPGSELLARIAGSFVALDDPATANQYLDLLDRVLLDRKISEPERRALEDLAFSLGLAANEVVQLNRHYMASVVEAVVADDAFTLEERATVIQLAGLLEFSAIEVEALLTVAESRVTRVDRNMALKSGDLIVLTGMSEDRKRQLTRVAQERGLVVWPNIKKGVAAVVAQDAGSNSGKAAKARSYGIPVVSEEEFEAH